MDYILSDRVQKVKPSPTLAVTQKATELRAAGHQIIGFGAGEPDFDTPDHIKKAGQSAIDQGKTRYTPVGGTVELKLAIQRKFKTENNLDYKLDEILVSCGGKHTIYNLIMAIINDGDEVLIPAPYWVSYPDMALLAGGKPVFIDAKIDADFKITAEQLEAHITPKTKLLIFNSPSNPTGACYSKEEMLALCKVLKKHPHVMILSDDIYEHLIYDNLTFHTIASICPELKDRTITMNGVSKAYAMTGWRIGYCGGPTPIIKAMQKIQSQSTSNPCSVSQAAATEALSGPQDFIKTNKALFQKRRDLIVNLINDCEGLNCPKPNGAFYVYPDCSALIGKKTPKGETISSDKDLSEYFLTEYHVALVLGEAFGSSPNIRISYALGEDDIIEGCKRIKEACANLR